MNNNLHVQEVRNNGHLAIAPTWGVENVIEKELALLNCPFGSYGVGAEGVLDLPTIFHSDYKRVFGNGTIGVTVHYGGNKTTEEFSVGALFNKTATVDGETESFMAVAYKLGGEAIVVNAGPEGGYKHMFKAKFQCKGETYEATDATLRLSIHGLALDGEFLGLRLVAGVMDEQLVYDSSKQSGGTDYRINDGRSPTIKAHQYKTPLWGADGYLDGVVVHIGGLPSKKVAMWAAKEVLRGVHAICAE